ncbi:MAG: hypothetical protein O2894_10925 [Planctomycetota bacterium]|nr:hypothetical protein [Planctomycetota bacterium]
MNAVIGDSGDFEATRSFPAAGTYELLAQLGECTWEGGFRVTATTRCTVTLVDREGEATRLHELEMRAFGPLGVVDGDACWELLQSQDLRIAPALWRYLESTPHQSDEWRRSAVLVLGMMWHIDSVPQFIALLTDSGVGDLVRPALADLGFRFLVDGGFMSLKGTKWEMPTLTREEWNPPPITDEDWRRLVEKHVPEWRKREPGLRALLHQ